jgi:hypothetical protein
MALLRCGRGLRRAYSCCGLWVEKGVFVHFSEDDTTGAANDITTTPWIALISCDANSTRASQSLDIFTLAYQRGALGAVLYSAWSQACIINPEYKSNNRLMHVFSTQSLASAQFILSQFSNINSGTYGEYNPSTLNASQAIINQSLEAGSPAGPGYLFSTLVAYNATGPSGSGVNTPATSDPGSSSEVGGGATSTGMAILKAVAGFIVGYYLF